MIITFKRFNLFDFYTGGNVIQDWADELPLQKKDRGRLDSKIDLLAKHGDDLPPKLLQPTRSRHIMEIAVNNQIAIRVMLCRGPFLMNNEFTFLFGATEKNRKYKPKDAPERADKNRGDLILNPNQRCKHEQFNKSSEESI
jgi:hypothetical protein